MAVVRCLMMWLLVLAVPAQGAAGVTLSFCGPGHLTQMHTAAAAPRSAPATHAHAGGETFDHASHGHAAQLAEADAHAPAGHGDTAHKLSSADKHKCSACASCCAAAALPAHPVVFHAPVLADVFLLWVPLSVTSFVTEGPERPPRASLA